jgi:hypothetical protein
MMFPASIQTRSKALSASPGSFERYLAGARRLQ